jgi:hypothetical protein
MAGRRAEHSFEVEEISGSPPWVSIAKRSNDWDDVYTPQFRKPPYYHILYIYI